jgi:hypothetical protein
MGGGGGGGYYYYYYYYAFKTVELTMRSVMK